MIARIPETVGQRWPVKAPNPTTGEQVILFNMASLCLVSGLVMTTKAKAAATDLNFETAMDRLEKIVEQMESGQLPLEELIVRYEEGMNLVKVCQERLASAEQKIEIIARNIAGQPVVKDFEVAAEPPTKQHADL